MRHADRQSAEALAELIFGVVHGDERPLRIRTTEADEQFVAHKTRHDPSGLKGVVKIRRLTLNLD